MDNALPQDIKPVPLAVKRKPASVMQVRLTNQQMREAVNAWLNRTFVGMPTCTSIKILKAGMKRRFVLMVKQ